MTYYYRPINTSLSIIDASLPEELNIIYPRYVQGSTEPTIKAELPPGDLPFTLSTSDVCSILSRGNVCKAAGTDGIQS